MKQKVMWWEGMVLRPHHFQQWDRYYEGLVAERFRTLDTFGWGVKDLAIDHTGLATGQLKIQKCSLVMPDGLVVDIPHSDDAPPSRMFRDHFPATTKHLGVYLGIPDEQPDGKTYQLESETGNRQARYRKQDVTFVNTITGEDPQPVQVARKQLQLLFGEESFTSITAVKIAELVRTQNGTITLDERYIPPLLWVDGSSTLTELVDGLINRLKEMRTSFSDDQRGTIDLIGTDLRKFALASAVFTHLPVLSHLREAEGGHYHPESLYIAMSQLAGQLMLLAPPGAAIKLAQYQHENLTDTFHRLEKDIRSLIEGGTPGYTNIHLTWEGDHWEGDVRLFTSAQFYCSVETPSDLSDEAVRSFVPGGITISAPSKLHPLLGKSSPGVTLKYKGNPSALPLRDGTQYFQLITDETDRAKWLWDEIHKEQKIALYVNGESLRGISPQLVAVEKVE
ncbi:MAG: type VI secretion system baseplate subunit TssK [Nitrospira sp.]|nr:type VI secretion system baseplate subunit TssK [Nitrospira sp.]